MKLVQVPAGILALCACLWFAGAEAAPALRAAAESGIPSEQRAVIAQPMLLAQFGGVAEDRLRRRLEKRRMRSDPSKLKSIPRGRSSSGERRERRGKGDSERSNRNGGRR